MSLPTLQFVDPQNATPTDSVLLAVYAPFGTDEVLSTYPDGSSVELAQHPLIQNLLKVAESGVHVVALVDRVDDDTYLVEIPARRAAQMKVISRWKQDMASPLTLAGFLREAHALHASSAVVLALEGHGAGFLPDLDRRQMSAHNLTGGGKFEWHIGADQGTPVLPEGSPMLPEGSPMLPEGSPMLPTNHAPMSTYGLGFALKSALARGCPKLAAIHFNNCFNMSVEVMHTVAPYAEYATGYMNYDFFTSGAAYPAVFHKLHQAGSASTEQLAQWFADANEAYLKAKGHHPTAGGVVRLARMHDIAERIDDLADALLSALRGASAAERPAVVAEIRQAIIEAQQYDTEAGDALETPDELTDILSLAVTLQNHEFGPHKVREAALALQGALEGIKRYGDNDTPWIDPAVRWDFSSPMLAMNIFLPDPLRLGLWDWRSPYYLDVNPDPTLPRVQPNIIEFVKVTDWVDFIIEYHKGAAFVGLRSAAIPRLPAFNAHYKPERPPTTPPRGGSGPNGGECGETPKRPSAA